MDIHRDHDLCPLCGEIKRRCCDSVIGLEHQWGCDGTPGNVAKRRSTALFYEIEDRNALKLLRNEEKP